MAKKNTKFNVGDKVRIIDVDEIMFGSRYWNNGDVTEVVSVSGGEPYLKRTNGVGFGVDYDQLLVSEDEFHAIEKVTEKVSGDSPDVTVDVSDKPLVFVQHSVGDDFTVYQDGKEVRGIRSVRIDAAMQDATTHEIEYLTGATAEKGTEKETHKNVDALDALQHALRTSKWAVTKQTPNELRKQSIKKAKKFVEDTKAKAEGGHLNYEGNSTFRGRTTVPEFIVNEDKRTVVVLIKGSRNPKLYEKGIAKCAPSDVFNADIGKAIALGRAYGLDTSDFELAPQPDDVVPGMVTKGKYSGNIYTVDKLIDNPQSEDIPGQAFKTTENSFGWVSDSQVDIISDTKAEY